MGAVARKAAEALGGRLSAVAERFWQEIPMRCTRY